MHPAFSVIFLTTLLGAGQGLFLALYTAQLYAFFDLMPVLDSRGFHGLGTATALAFLAAGLLASRQIRESGLVPQNKGQSLVRREVRPPMSPGINSFDPRPPNLSLIWRVLSCFPTQACQNSSLRES